MWEYKLIHDFGIYHMFFRYAWHNCVARNYFGHCIVGKIQDGLHICKDKLYILPSFSTEMTGKHNFGVYYRVFRHAWHSVWLECTLDIALLVKSKMAAICEKQKLLLLSTEWKEIRDFGNNHVGFSYVYRYTPLWLTNIILDSQNKPIKMAVIRQTKCLNKAMTGHKLCLTFHYDWELHAISHVAAVTDQRRKCWAIITITTDVTICCHSRVVAGGDNQHNCHLPRRLPWWVNGRI